MPSKQVFFDKAEASDDVHEVHWEICVLKSLTLTTWLAEMQSVS